MLSIALAAHRLRLKMERSPGDVSPVSTITLTTQKKLWCLLNYISATAVPSTSKDHPIYNLIHASRINLTVEVKWLSKRQLTLPLELRKGNEKREKWQIHAANTRTFSKNTRLTTTDCTRFMNSFSVSLIKQMYGPLHTIWMNWQTHIQHTCFFTSWCLDFTLFTGPFPTGCFPHSRFSTGQVEAFVTFFTQKFRAIFTTRFAWLLINFNPNKEKIWHREHNNDLNHLNLTFCCLF